MGVYSWLQVDQSFLNKEFMELKDSHQNQAHPTDLLDRICERASNIIGNINGSQLAKMKKSIPDMSLP